MQVSEQNINDLQDKLWYVIKCEDQNIGSQTQNLNTNNTNEFVTIQSKLYQYTIKLNDIIKLGRVKYAVTEIKVDDTNTERPTKKVFDLVYEATYNIINISGPPENFEDDTMCKICLTNANDEKINPFITLCKCNGSMQCIHYDCLKKWMAIKLQIKNNEKKSVVSYNMKAFNCEICKTPYPCNTSILNYSEIQL